MVVFEALNALYGDCLLLRYDSGGGVMQTWLIDGGPRAEFVAGARLYVLDQVLLPRLKQIDDTVPFEIELGMVSHIDDDHINGVDRLMQRLDSAADKNFNPVSFDRFWFNSFDAVAEPGTQVAAGGEAGTASLEAEALPEVPHEDSQAIVQSVKQGKALAVSLSGLQLGGNPPFQGVIVAKPGQKPVSIGRAKVTVLGPLQSRLDKLRKDWAAARGIPDKAARQAALQDLFLPDKKLDTSVPNLSSIVVLVEVGGRRLLLTGDAQGKDVVTAWQELGLEDGPVTIDLLKMPHHGSIRNTPEVFLRFFEATHYVFSANGKDDNPDAATVEALVKVQGKRPIVMSFTNPDITWQTPHTLETGGEPVTTLAALLEAMRTGYPGPWAARFREDGDLSVVVNL